MLLNYQVHGEGEPLIILHGLFGTSENWGSQIKSLAEQFQVIAVDMRDHGRSPHTDEISYELMAKDIINLMEHLQLEAAHIIGHSMGGKAAMQLALLHPDRIKKLIIVDIAPVQYTPHHDDVFKGLFSVELPSLKSRGDADKQLANSIPELGVRAFLLKNLYKNENGEFSWRMNLPLLHKQYSNISAAPQGQPYQKPVLFIKGGKSDYLIPKYRDAVIKLFPKADYKVIRDAGHWPHAEKPAKFTDIVLSYL
ncbi:alpha/beta fold hydrolase [Neptuniibacter caesariensis]|uniref:Alpha/beta superfamily hydrolase n=1 Tax=Neptuniibacter caesariensis TaxID=207954 RepID=A0A7U8GS29_NEPCE|nr:alpha/beta fold hydrolase [Neptuniibacter caesariensis]EAR60832.1 alpha/beta superfamily hydrolase [Oceanospirillum sp. MED92] [Neptuniibacter caesariensis]